MSPTTPPVTTVPRTSGTAPISLPPNLCAATDKAQDTADAFLGALSAGQLGEALKCVLPGAVSVELTTSLVSQQKQTAAYLPVGATTGPVFTYRGGGKTILVTVTRQADEKTWVSGLEVR